MPPLKSILLSVANMVALVFCPAAVAQPITLDVTFKLTDIDYKPLPGVPVRLLFGSDPDWQSPNAGYSFTTDEKGEAHVTAKASLDKRVRKIPTNAIDSFFQLPKPYDHLMTGADLDFMNVHSLYMVDLVVLPGGTVSQENFMLYTADDRGRFTRRTEPGDYRLVRTDLKNQVLRGPGFEPWDFMLQPDASDPTHQKWTLTLAFKKSPPPIQR